MLSVEQLSLDFKTFALNNIGFELPDRSTLVILGRSGAGKTLLLETIAGKYRHTGSISMNGIALHTMPPEKRNISLVYQNFGLFPFLTVFENTVFGEKLRGIPKQQYTAQSERLLAINGRISARYDRTAAYGRVYHAGVGFKSR